MVLECMDTGAKGASLQGRRAIDGASSKDRGRLLGLWNRWNAKPGDDAAREAFAAALARSVEARELRAARAAASGGGRHAAHRGRSRTHRRTDPSPSGGRDRGRNRLGQDHAVAEAVPGRRPRRRRHDRLHAAAPHRRARGGASRRGRTEGAGGRRGRLPGALHRQRLRADRGEVHDRRHPARGNPVRPLAVGLRHDHRRRGARTQPQHRFPARLSQATDRTPQGPEDHRHLGDDRHRAFLRALQRCAGGERRRPRLSGGGALAPASKARARTPAIAPCSTASSVHATKSRAIIRWATR